MYGHKRVNQDNQLFTVTRQHYFYSGDYVVEVVQGRDNVGPDALARRYYGEWDTYADPCDAMRAALIIARDWSEDDGIDAYANIGSTWGATLELAAGDEGERPTEEDLKARAQAWREKLTKCDACGEVITTTPLSLDGDDSWAFCDESCVERYMREYVDDDIVDDDADDYE